MMSYIPIIEPPTGELLGHMFWWGPCELVVLIPPSVTDSKVPETCFDNIYVFLKKNSSPERTKYRQLTRREWT